jgi:hypothetical protein
MSNKKELGQFFTSNYNYILQDLQIPRNTTHIIEPFAGNGDLINFIPDSLIGECIIECFDIEPQHPFILQRDTLTDPPCYNDTFILTNPPYLARNKCATKRLFDLYNVNDLYKCFLVNLISNTCSGGIVIIPLNFWSSIRKMDVELRKAFMQVYDVYRVNVFEEQVFNDTSYTVCAFQFGIKSAERSNAIVFNIFPYKKSIDIELSPYNNYTIGGEIYKLPRNNAFYVGRLVKGCEMNTNIVCKCIDDNADNQIGLRIVSNNDVYVDDTPNRTARTYATLVITPTLSMEQQEDLVKRFNSFLRQMREQYHSLFMTNYRESNSIARKRISFDLVYQIIEHLLTYPSVGL